MMVSFKDIKMTFDFVSLYIESECHLNSTAYDPNT